MPFSESVKMQVKRRAAFRCCRCQQIGVDVHHVVPEKDGGSDDITNAAPLCQNCHDQFGDNPRKRKEIGELRDWWYEVCEDRYSQHGDLQSSCKLDHMLERLQKSESGIEEIKHLLKEIADRTIEGITPGTVGSTASRIMDIAEAPRAGSVKQTRVKQGRTLITWVTDMDVYNADELRCYLLDILESDADRHVILDMTDVAYLDAGGLGVLVGVLKRLREQNGTLELITNPKIERLLHITRLDQLFTVYASRDAADL